MFLHIKKILEILPASDKAKLLMLLAMMMVAALLEVAGIGMIPLFVGIVAAPDRVLEVENLKPVWAAFSIEDGGDLLVFGSAALIVVFVLKNLYIVGFRYVESKFVYNRYRSISNRLFERYMTAPYIFSLSRNTAELLRNIMVEARLLISSLLTPSLKLVKDSVMIIAISALLIVVEPVISLIVLLFLGGVGAVFMKLLKSRMKQYGEEAQHDRLMMTRTIKEGLGGLKDITVLNRQGWFLNRFDWHVSRFSRSQVFKSIATASGRPVVETLAIIGLLLISSILYHQGRELEVILSILALFGAATVKLLPLLQRFIASFNELRYYANTVDTVHKDLVPALPGQGSDPGGEVRDSVKRGNPEPSEFRQSIRFSGVSYRYPDSEAQAVLQLDLEIKKGEAVAFVGPSGAGKTTIVDLILGLLEPDEGTVRVDGKDIGENRTAWQLQMGYIPQFIFLSDDTIRRNIAFGLPDEEIDDEAIMAAVEAAQLTELLSSIDKGLDAVIGERGVRLSGGQRQRIGIARALYHNPSVLIMDEATSALDNVTEKYVIEAIERFKGERTLVMIAHRLTTVQNCDRLYFMKEGEIVDQGTYNDLIAGNQEFQKMAMIKVEG